MTEPVVPDQPPPQPSAGSLLGALALGLLGILFLLSTGCFGVFGITFLADGQGAAWILVICGIVMGLLTYFTLRGARRLYLGPPQPISVVPPAASPTPPDDPSQPPL